MVARLILITFGWDAFDRAFVFRGDTQNEAVSDFEYIFHLLAFMVCQLYFLIIFHLFVVTLNLLMEQEPPGLLGPWARAQYACLVIQPLLIIDQETCPGCTPPFTQCRLS